MERSPHLVRAKERWKQFLLPGDGVIDATCGNGHDTLFLATLPLSYLVAFDIQKEAIEQTQNRLKQQLSVSDLAIVTLFHRSHEDFSNMPPQPKPPRLIVYNLGYLPGGDKTVTTRAESTRNSVNSALSFIHPEGALSITCYPGHPEGRHEKELLLDFLANLSPTQWKISHDEWNQRPDSPSLLWVQGIRF